MARAGRCAGLEVPRSIPARSTRPFPMEESALVPETQAGLGRDASRPRGEGVDAPLEGLRALLGNLAQLLGSHALVAAAGLASLPVLARNLGAEAYGRFSLFVLALGVLANLDVARPILVRELSRGDAGESGTSDAADLAATSGWLLALPAAALGWLVGGPLAALALAVSVHLHALTAAPFARLSAQGRVGLAGSIRNGFWAAALAVTVAASFRTTSAHAWLWAFAAANGLILWGSLRAAPGGVRPLRLPSFAALRRVRVQASDVLVFALASAVVASCDRLLLDATASDAVLGRYSAQYDLAIKLNIVSTALCSVVYPSFSRTFAEAGSLEASRRFVRLASRIAALYFAGLVVLVLAHEPVTRLVLGAELGAGDGPNVYPVLLVGVFIHLFGFLITPYQRARGDFRTHRIAYCAAAAAMVAVGLWAVPRYGATGALMTYLTGRLAEVSLIVVEVRRLPREALAAWRVWALGAMVAAIAGLAWFALEGGGAVR